MGAIRVEKVILSVDVICEWSLGLREVEVAEGGEVLERLSPHLADVAAVHLQQLQLPHAAHPRHLGDLGGNSVLP